MKISYAGRYDYSRYNESIYSSENVNGQIGFTYNGIHCTELGLYYVPNEYGRGDFFSPYEVISAEKPWFSGGNYSTTRVKSRVFELDCFYDEIDYRTRERIIKWLDRRTSGKLVFDNRPYAEYYVRPTEAPKVKDYHMGDKYSGVFTIKFTAFDPCAQLTCNYLENDSSGNCKYEAYLIPLGMIPSDEHRDETNFPVYNPGTEIGHSIIEFKGKVGETDLTIYNAATENKCTIKHGLDTGNNTLVIDSKTGRVKLVTPTSETTYFEYHDDGYITFVPSEILYRDIMVSTTAGSRIITSASITDTSDLVGRYIYVDGEWKYIGSIVNGNIQVNTPCSTTETQNAYIMVMNTMSITKGSDAVIDKLTITCKPEVR